MNDCEGKGAKHIYILDKFFKEYGISNIGSVETSIIKLNILIEFMEEEKINIDSDFDMYKFKRKIFYLFYIFQLTDYQKLLPFINTNKEESKQLKIFFECVDLIFSSSKNEFQISYDQELYNNIVFPLLLENKSIIKLISKKLSLKTLFLSDEELKIEIIDEIMLMIEVAIKETDIVEKMDDKFVSNVFNYLNENRESIKKIAG
jgi:hypothetical protein